MIIEEVAKFSSEIETFSLYANKFWTLRKMVLGLLHEPSPSEQCYRKSSGYAISEVREKGLGSFCKYCRSWISEWVPLQLQ